MKTIIITGGAGHLGRAVARWWARPDVSIVLIDRDAKRLEESRADLAASGADLAIIAADLTAPEDSKAIGEISESLLPKSPSLILAHGVAAKGRGGVGPRLGELDRKSWEESLDGNLTSAVFTIQTLLPMMRGAGGGRIVLVSSAAGVGASPTAALSYSVAKAAIAALPRLLAPDLAANGVLINAVAPGKFVNPDWPDDPSRVKRYEATIPLGRLASAEEVAALIGFLSSDANTYITGQTILHDGGRLQTIP
jgi:NAD(P)-dependent dehydrogenase (short-subunit alcohol dehydrogenase family)